MATPAIGLREVRRRRVRGRPPTPGLRDAILRAAEGVFTRRDYHEVQMDDVAAACGVGKGTLYRYFRSKRELYFAVTFDGIEHLRDAVAAAVRSSESAPEAIEHIVRRTLGFFWDRRGFFALIHRHELKPDADVREWFTQRAGLTRLVEDAIRRAIAAGDMRPVDPRIATEMLFGMMRAANRYRTRTDAFESLVQAVVDTFMRGVATHAGQRRIAAVQQRKRA
jgi:TetR/AcrR family fatty acid metabolism transcriptional regulator